MPRKAQKNSTKLRGLVRIKSDPTSSLNKYFMCECEAKFSGKTWLIKHLKKCRREEKLKRVTCDWCKLVFKSRGNLVTHAKHMHGDNSYKTAEPFEKCTACEQVLPKYKIKQHIRRSHYNLLARIPLCETFKVNQVWFEKEQNSNSVIEIKKITNNMLILRKMAPGTTVKVTESPKLLNLHNLYPSGKRNNAVTSCPYCHKVMSKVHIKKHIDELHMQLFKHKCNNCGLQFKRSYAYLKHVCFLTRQRRRKIMIDNVQSLAPVMLD